MAQRIKAKVVRTKGPRKGTTYTRYFKSHEEMYKFLARQRKLLAKRRK